MKVAIIEDEIPAGKQLVSLLQQLEHETEVLFEARSVKEAVQQLKINRPDLLFMDIQLNDGLSFEIFKEAEVGCPVVFTTAYDQYMLEAFHENGIDYLLKPIRRNDLERAFRKFSDLKSHFSADMQAAVLRMNENKTGYRKRFLVKKGVSFKSVPAEEICYFFSEHKITFLVTPAAEKCIFEKPLSDLEAELDPDRFFRINRKYIASRNAVESFRSFEKGKLLVRLVPETKEEVIVSQEKASAFKEWMG